MLISQRLLGLIDDTPLSVGWASNHRFALEHWLTEEKHRLNVTPQDLAADIVAHLQFLQGPVETVKQRLCEHLQAHESRPPRRNYAPAPWAWGKSTAAWV